MKSNYKDYKDELINLCENEIKKILSILLFEKIN